MRLPVSGLDVTFRLPDGHDDLAILESRTASPHPQDAYTILERALDALTRLTMLTQPTDFNDSFDSTSLQNSHPTTPRVPHLRDSLTIAKVGSLTNATLPFPDTTITDFEHALLGLRRFLFGDSVHSLVRCTCSERMEIEFSIATLLRDSHPCTPSRVLPAPDRPGWFTLPEKHIAFRLPTVADQLHVLTSPHPYAVLEQRCIDAPHPDRRTLSTVERAMEIMAPAVSRPITGICAACGESIRLQLHVPTLVLHELCASASGIHREIHAIAATYHWPESTILALPQLRRQAYIEVIHQSQGLTNGQYSGGAL